MHGVKLTTAKRSIEYCLTHLPPGSKASLVSFGLHARLEHPLSADMHSVLAAVQRMVAHGPTHLSQGLELGLHVLAEEPTRHVVLLTDGEATHGARTEDELRELLGAFPHFRNTLFHVVGVGQVNESLLRSLAYPEGSPDGSFLLIQKSWQIAETIGQVMGTLTGAFAQNAEITWSVDTEDDNFLEVSLESQFSTHRHDGCLKSKLGLLAFDKPVFLFFTMPVDATLHATLRYMVSGGVTETHELNIRVPVLSAAQAQEEKVQEHPDVRAWSHRIRTIEIIRTNDFAALKDYLAVLEHAEKEQPHPVIAMTVTDVERILATPAEQRHHVQHDYLSNAALQRSSSINQQPGLQSALERTHSLQARDFVREEHHENAVNHPIAANHQNAANAAQINRLNMLPLNDMNALDLSVPRLFRS